MMGKNHVFLATGIYGGLLVISGIPVEAPLLFVGKIVSVGIGALLPDIDSPNSSISRKLRPLSYPISEAVKHRGVTHSLLACLVLLTLLLAGSLTQINSIWVSMLEALWIGYLSHIMGDWMTTEGVPLFWPYKKYFHSPLSFKTGGTTERLLGVVLRLGTFALLFDLFILRT